MFRIRMWRGKHERCDEIREETRDLKPRQASLYFCRFSGVVEEDVFGKERPHVGLSSVNLNGVLNLLPNHEKECERFKEYKLEDKKPKDIDW